MHSRYWRPDETVYFPAPDPVSLGLSAATLASLSTGASIAGGVTTAVGAIAGGIGSYNAYSYKAQVAQNNAAVAKSNATYAMAAGEIEAQNQGIKDRYQMGRILTSQAASGFDVNTGSPLAVRESQQGANARNQMVIRSNASRKAYGYEVEAANFMNESKASEAAGTNALIAGGINSLGSVVGTTATVSDKWLSYAKAGIPGYGVELNTSG